MNITELARALRISPQELRDILPQLGFNIGQRAIKVDNYTAKKIIKEWPRLYREWQEKKLREKKEKEIEESTREKVPVSVPMFITARDLSALSQIPVNKILSQLMKNGVFISMNEKIDFDTVSIIGADLGLEVSLAQEKEGDDKKDEKKKLEEFLKQEAPENLQERPPVIVVMGHVDHGKTRLLDAIRKTNVVAGEAGGITQHIGAYQVKRKDKTLTFIDTPGHEAFTAMRSRGAKVADVAILVVAADDGVKPQTVEAFRIIEAAKVPYLVAINKIDKPEADVNKTKQELSTMLNITPEDWGGKTVCIPVSAKDNTGIDSLLDMIVLLADTEASTLKANPNSPAVGTIVEARVDKGAGPIATILIQNGTLKIGDELCLNNIFYGKVKSLKNYKGEAIEEAGPSVPARILGLKILPEVGDLLQVSEGGEKVKASKIVSKNTQSSSVSAVENENDTSIKLNVIIKSDVLGSAEAIEESLLKINTEKVKVKIISKGLGNVNESDVRRAESANAEILEFNVKVQPQIENLIREKNIKISSYSVIYDLIKHVKVEMQKLVQPEIIRVDLGRLKVLAVFRSENKSQIVGGKVLDGIIENNCLLEVVKNKEVVEKGQLVKLQSGKQDVERVEKDTECGLKYEGRPVIEVGDILQAYKEEAITDKI